MRTVARCLPGFDGQRLRGALVLVALLATALPVRAQSGLPQDMVDTLAFLTEAMNDPQGRFEFLIRRDDPCAATCGYQLNQQWFYHLYSFDLIAPNSFSPRQPSRGLQQLRFNAVSDATFPMEVYDGRDRLLYERPRPNAQCVVPLAQRDDIVQALDYMGQRCRELPPVF